MASNLLQYLGDVERADGTQARLKLSETLQWHLCDTEVALMAVSARNRNETSCFTRSILPRHAEVVTPRCEALGTM